MTCRMKARRRCQLWLNGVDLMYHIGFVCYYGDHIIILANNNRGQDPLETIFFSYSVETR